MQKEALELYDEIIYMDQGRIVEMGSFEELMERWGGFYEFFRLKK